MMTISLTLMIFPDTDLGDSFVSVIWCQSKHAIFNILVLLCGCGRISVIDSCSLYDRKKAVLAIKTSFILSAH